MLRHKEQVVVVLPVAVDVNLPFVAPHRRVIDRAAQWGAHGHILHGARVDDGIMRLRNAAIDDECVRIDKPGGDAARRWVDIYIDRLHQSVFLHVEVDQAYILPLEIRHQFAEVEIVEACQRIVRCCLPDDHRPLEARTKVIQNTRDSVTVRGSELVCGGGEIHLDQDRLLALQPLNHLPVDAHQRIVDRLPPAICAHQAHGGLAG